MMRLHSDIKGYDNSAKDPITYLKNHLEAILDRKKVSEDDKINVCILLQALDKHAANQIIEEHRISEPFRVFADIIEGEERVRTKGWKRKTVGYDMVTEEKPWFAAGTLLIKLAKKYYKGNAYKFRIVKDIADFWEHNDPKNDLDDHADIYDQGPKGFSNNDLYRWTKGWEFDVDPLDHKNFKSFMRKRVKEQLKYKPEIVRVKLVEKEAEDKKLEQQRLEVERTEKLKKQEEIEKLRSKRYESIETVARDPGVYVLCEKKKIFTKVKNKCNALYVGESLVFSSRVSAYQHFNNPNNELVKKLVNKLKKPKDYIIQRIKDNVRIKVLRFKSMENNDHRKEIEGYLIKRLNPLINSSKRNGFYKRSFIEKKEDEDVYWAEVEYTYKTQLYTFGDTKTIYHVGKKDFVKRESLDGEEAMDIQFQRSFNTWVKENNIKNRKNEWEEDPEAFYAGLTGLRDLWKYKKLKQEKDIK